MANALRDRVKKAYEKAHDKELYWQNTMKYAEKHDPDNVDKWRINWLMEGEKASLLKALLDGDGYEINLWV